MKSRSPSPAVFSPILTALLLFGLVFALFAPSIRYGFVEFDDLAYVVGNRLVHPGLTLSSIRGAFASPPSDVGMYMPVLWLSYMADVTFFGASIDNPAPFHAVNVVLHAANAVLLFFLLRRLLSLARPLSPPSPVPRHSSLATLLPPFLLALLWAVHPLRVESVAWITERKDTLSLFCSLLSCLFYLHAASDSSAPRRQSALARALAAVFFAAAMLAKPTLVPFPCLLVLLDVFVLRRPLSLRLFFSKTHYFLFAAAIALATVFGHAAHLPRHLPFAARLAHLPQTLAHYVLVSLLPRHLTLLDPRPAFAFLPALADAVLLLLLLALAFRLRRCAPLAALGILWSFLFLVPVSGLATIPNNAVADRFSYVPAIGFSVALLPLFDSRLLPSASARRLVWAVAAALLPVLAFLSLRQLPHWRSSDAIYDRVRRFAPLDPFVAVHDAHAAISASGDFPAAFQAASASYEANPLSAQLIGVVATCIANRDGPVPAIDFLLARPATAGHLRAAWAWQLAHLSLHADRPADALSFAADAENNLSSFDTLHANIQRLRVAASVPPDFPDALPHYISQWMIYERADALEFFRRFTAANPDRPDVLGNVAWILATAGWSPAPPSEALDYATRALALAGDRPPPELLDTCAAALANASDFPAAAATQERAISLLPPDSPALPDYQSRLDLYRHSTPYRHDIGISW